MSEFSERLRLLMLSRHVSQAELAKLTGLTTASINHYVKGIREPRLEAVSKMAKALFTTIDYLVHGTKMEANFHLIIGCITECRESLTVEQKYQLIKYIAK